MIILVDSRVTLSPGLPWSRNAPHQSSLSIFSSLSAPNQIPHVLITTYPNLPDHFYFFFPRRSISTSLYTPCYLASFHLWIVAWLSFTAHTAYKGVHCLVQPLTQGEILVLPQLDVPCFVVTHGRPVLFWKETGEVDLSGRRGGRRGKGMGGAEEGESAIDM